VEITQSIESAIAYHQEGDLQQAEALYLEILEKQPNNSNVLHNLGVVYLQAGNHQLAITYIKKAIQLSPCIFFMHYNLGNAFRETDNPEEAINSYLKAIQYNPELIDAYDKLAIILQARGQLDKAISYYDRAIQLNPNFADNLYKLGVTLHNNGQVDDAMKCYKKALQFSPSRFDIYADLGISFYNKLQLEEAALHIQKALELNPNCAEGYFYLGMISKENGEYDKAITCLQKALQLNPDSIWTYTNMGVVLQRMGQLKEAQEYFQKAVRLNPNIGNPSNNLGSSLQDKGQLQEVMHFYKKTNKSTILIVVNAFNRGKITQLSLAQIKRYKTPYCHLQVYNDHSTEYNDSFLLPYADEVIKLPDKMGYTALRWHQLRKFIETDFDFLYITDNDVIHDPEYINVLEILYEIGNGQFPVSLYNGIFTSQPRMMLFCKNGIFLKSTAPGCSMYYDRNMVNNILEKYEGDKTSNNLTWDNQVVEYLNLPWITPEISYVDHYGAGGISNTNYDRDSAVNPTRYLHERRDAVLQYLTQDIDLPITF
jgi:tetratricopeptide (TPR) repeat protein